jgi:hypothetical protein
MYLRNRSLWEIRLRIDKFLSIQISTNDLETINKYFRYFKGHG